MLINSLLLVAALHAFTKTCQFPLPLGLLKAIIKDNNLTLTQFEKNQLIIKLLLYLLLLSIILYYKIIN